MTPACNSESTPPVPIRRGQTGLCRTSATRQRAVDSKINEHISATNMFLPVKTTNNYVRNKPLKYGPSFNTTMHEIPSFLNVRKTSTPTGLFNKPAPGVRTTVPHSCNQDQLFKTQGCSCFSHCTKQRSTREKRSAVNQTSTDRPQRLIPKR